MAEQFSTPWKYVSDSFDDSVNGDDVSGTVYEMTGIAVREVGDRLVFAIKSNFPDEGAGVVEWGDLFLNFTGQNLADLTGPQENLFGIRFNVENDSAAPELGLYNNVELKSVAKENGLQVDSLQEYIDYVEAKGIYEGRAISPFGVGTHSFGELPADSGYFNRSVNIQNSIQDGDYLGKLELLNSEQLQALGLDFGNIPGEHIIGFSVDKNLLPTGTFIAHVGPECGNDIITIQGEVSPPVPSIQIEKKTNGVDADTLEEAAPVAPGSLVTWTYEVTNTGSLPFQGNEIIVEDDQGLIPVLDIRSDVDIDGILSPGETWVYTVSETAPQLFHVIDFEVDGEGNPLEAGTWIDDEYANIGLTISAPETKYGAMIFDSAKPTGSDPDLGTPHNDFDGPGEGQGGGKGKLGENNKPLDNILIISEDGDPYDPDDEANGGVLQFDFEAPSKVYYIDILDSSKPGTVTTFDSNGDILNVYDIQPYEKNGIQRVLMRGEEASSIKVDLKDSAAVTELAFERSYQNIGTVQVPGKGLTDNDPSTLKIVAPGIDLEKLTNGIDGDTAASAVAIKSGEAVTWTYKVTNTGNVAFNVGDVVVTDDQGILPIFDATSDAFGDGILSPGETWIYKAEGAAEQLTVNIDFDQDALGNSLERGITIDDEYADLGLRISTPGYTHGAMIFDSNNPTGKDYDLRSPKQGVPDLNNILIISENGDASNPDDKRDGGVMRFDWDDPVRLFAVGLLDIDEDGGLIKTFDDEGRVLEEVDLKNKGNNSYQTVTFDANLISRMEVHLVGSGAITGLNWSGIYQNLGAVSVHGFDGVSDSDLGHYLNPAEPLF